MSDSLKSKILEHLKVLQFKLSEDNFWTKDYNNHNNCKIRIHIQNGEIEYPSEMQINNKSTSKLLKSEDFVVLECIDRLLEMGYPAKKIELERTWKLGRLDILVKCLESEDIYMMIECKTYESYDEAKKKMKKDGGQLFYYLQQDKSAKFLCLYASWVINFGIKNVYSVVPVNKAFRNSHSMIEAYNSWDKKFITDGLFDDGMSRYQIPE